MRESLLRGRGFLLLYCSCLFTALLKLSKEGEFWILLGREFHSLLAVYRKPFEPFLGSDTASGPERRWRPWIWLRRTMLVRRYLGAVPFIILYICPSFRKETLCLTGSHPTVLKWDGSKWARGGRSSTKRSVLFWLVCSICLLFAETPLNQYVHA